MRQTIGFKALAVLNLTLLEVRDGRSKGHKQLCHTGVSTGHIPPEATQGGTCPQLLKGTAS